MTLTGTWKPGTLLLGALAALTMLAAGCSKDECTGGKTKCNGSCVDINTSAKHCGACGLSCGEGQTCSQGACVCDAGQKICGGKCVKLDTKDNCGACGNVCAKGEQCVPKDGGGVQCGCPVEQGYYYDQDTDYCYNLVADKNNCGAIGNVCDTSIADGRGDGVSVPLCTSRRCTVRCAEGTKECQMVGTDANIQNACCKGTGCVNLYSDPKNCGYCGNVCPGDAANGLTGICVQGGCQVKCKNDADNQPCIANAIGQTAACDASTGKCKSSCAAGETVCNSGGYGVCTNTSTDSYNCGKCGTQCNGNQECAGGGCIAAGSKQITCTITASSGWQTCNASVKAGAGNGGAEVVADDYVLVDASGKWRTSFSVFGGDSGPEGGPSSPYKDGADYRYSTFFNYNELLWRVKGSGTLYGFSSGKQQVSDYGLIEIRNNITDDQIDAFCSGDMSVTITVSK
jgi:hypothetical protein